MADETPTTDDPKPNVDTPDNATADAPQHAGDLTADEIDAILRDPDVPGDVRATVLETYSVRRYLDTHEFHKNDDDGVTHARVRQDA